MHNDVKDTFTGTMNTFWKQKHAVIDESACMSSAIVLTCNDLEMQIIIFITRLDAKLNIFNENICEAQEKISN